MANIQELSPQIMEALQLEKIFLEREIKSIQQYLNKEVDRRTDKRSASEDLLNMKEQDKMRLCSHCQKKSDGLCRVCSHKFSQRKPQSSSSTKIKVESRTMVQSTALDNIPHASDVSTNAKPQPNEDSILQSISLPPPVDSQQSKLRLRIQGARDEHFLSDDL